MSTYLFIHKARVENANTVAGSTWGFPSIGQFLGFTHALGRKLDPTAPVLGGCAIICNEHQAHTGTDDYGVHRFCLTRNPLTKEGKTAPFNEEGRMHLTVTLIIEVLIDLEDYFDNSKPDESSLDEKKHFEQQIERVLPSLRLAGGSITAFEPCKIRYLNPNDEGHDTKLRRLFCRALPGFALVNRNDLLPLHHHALQQAAPETSVVEAWMDFGGLRYRYGAPAGSENEDGEASQGTPTKQTNAWPRVDLPETGWFVPLMMGYRAIAPLQPAGSVVNSRDSSVPFCPVESVYGVGQWLSPHRVRDIEQLIWRYHYDGSANYLFKNTYTPESSITEGA